MTITNGYCTLAELKATDVLKITDSTSDSLLEGIIEAISRAIDLECARFFYKDANDATRYFRASNPNYLYMGDMAGAPTSITTDSPSGNRSYPYTWATTDCDLLPDNAALDGLPYQQILRAPQGRYFFDARLSRGVKIVGKWGWPAVPKQIHEACLLWSERMFKRYKTPLGVSGATPFGESAPKVPPPDPDVMFLIGPFRLNVIG